MTNKTPINEAIALIIGEEAEEKRVKACGPHNSAYKLEPIYPDYLHDANAAIEAWKWADGKLSVWGVNINMNSTHVAHVSGKRVGMGSFGRAICEAVIWTAQEAHIEFDYNSIDWREE